MWLQSAKRWISCAFAVRLRGWKVEVVVEALVMIIAQLIAAKFRAAEFGSSLDRVFVKRGASVLLVLAGEAGIFIGYTGGVRHELDTGHVKYSWKCLVKMISIAVWMTTDAILIYDMYSVYTS